MKVIAKQIKKLREETGAPILRVKKVLEEHNGDEKKALSILRKEGFEKAAKRKERATGQGTRSAVPSKPNVSFCPCGASQQ